MKKFARRRGLLTTHLDEYEVELLSSLVSQLVELVSDGEPGGFEVTERGPTDSFDAIVANLEVDPDEPEQSEDPVLKRLFPNAYPDDPAASSDFRRFTERQLKAKKVADAQVVLDRLSGTEQGRHELRIPPDGGGRLAAHPDQRAARPGDPAGHHRRGDRGSAVGAAGGGSADVHGQRLRLARVRGGNHDLRDAMRIGG